MRIDGHDPDAIAAAIEKAQASDRPTMIACRTVIGYGSPHRAGTSKAHGEPLGADEMAATRAELGWDYAPFEIPDDILGAWRAAGARNDAVHQAWTARFAAEPEARRDEFERRVNHILPAGLDDAIDGLKRNLIANPQTVATRKASEIALEVVTVAVPELILGSADLTPSNNTKTKNLKEISTGDFAGRYIHYGIREHGMAAAMNGLALHGGFRPAGATFFVFTDYCRPSIRIAALSEIPAIYVMTHDSIGLGEDGPTHQPVEHLASLRAMPNLAVFRPADTVETAEAWQIAIKRTSGPTLLALSRQNLPQVRHDHVRENLSAAGAYELAPAEGGKAEATIFASGSEVELALAAREQLKAQGVAARVVSVPSLDVFLEQPQDVRDAIIGDAPVRVAVEAGVRFGWDAVIGETGGFVGMNSFGASAPYKEVYKHFGITAEAVVDAVLKRRPA